MRKITLLIALSLLFINFSFSQVTVWNEDFSTATTNFTVTLGAEGNDGAADYFQRTDGSNIGIAYTGNINEFFAAQDVDDGGWLGSAAPAQLTWTGVNIAGYTSLSFEGLFASNATAKIDASDSTLVEINIDGAGWLPLISFRNDGTQFNTFFLEDTDFDGIGDGTQLTSTFANFTKSIALTGTSMDIRITTSVNAGGEDIAFDEFYIKGISSSTQTLTWNATTFNEAIANDGSISNQISVTLANETFAAGALAALAEGVDYSVANVPAGLTVGIITTSVTEATIALTGNATNHADIDDVSNLTITFLDAAFTGGDASVVTNSSNANLIVDFIDGAPTMEMAWDTTYYYEDIANDGSISNVINLTLSNETFATVDTLVSGTDYLATNIPAGLAMEIITTTASTATIALTGNATAHTAADNITNLSVAFLDAAFTGGDANAVSLSTRTDLSVNYTDGYANDLIITEISYNSPEVGVDSLEFIEIYNNGTEIADLTDFYMAGITYVFGNVSVNPGEFIILSVDSLKFDNFFGVASYEWPNGGLSNNGELVAIYNPNGDVVDEVTYDDIAPWPNADGSGHSMVFCDLSTDNNLGENWTISTNFVDTLNGGLKLWASPNSFDVVCSLNPTIAWSDTIFTEALTNDGSIGNNLSLTLTDDEFLANDTLAQGVEYTVANVPAGLDVVIVANSTTTADVFLIGNATAHTNADDVLNMEITFTDTAFVSGFATNVVDYSLTNLIVDFDDVISVLGLNNENTSIYPNPAINTINFDNLDNIDQIEIVDVLGNIVTTINVKSNNTSIDVACFKSGLYIARLKSGNDIKSIKFIKK